MEINKELSNGILKLSLIGELNTKTTPALMAEVDGIESDVKRLILDLAQLEYTSSSGLRALLKAQKKMNKQGGMIVKNVNQMVMEVLEITGFVDILTIE